MGAIITAKIPLSTKAWDALLSPLLFPKTSVSDTISELRPLFMGPDHHSHPIQLLHQSVRDYLIWRGGNEVQAALEPAKDQERLALRCFTITNTELRKVAGLGIFKGLGKRDEMTTIPQREISEQLVYASCYGLQHMSHVQHVSRGLEIEIEKFLQERITDWLELCVRADRYISILPFFDWIKVSHGNARQLLVNRDPTGNRPTMASCLQVL